ncbi:MAG: hypothetical protein ACYTKD_22690 [Planctomycetota bacterium]|jgi:hypothetical protein
MAGKKKRAKGAKPKGSPGKAKAPKAPPAGAKTANGKEKPAKKSQTDLAPLKAKAEEAKKGLTRAENEAAALRAQAKTTEAAAKKAYAEAVAPYRDACRKAGVKCEFAGARAANKTPAVRFLVEKVRDGVKVAIKGRPETEEVIPTKALDESIGKAAVAYVDKFIGDRATVGNKAGGLGNRLRAALKAE